MADDSDRCGKENPALKGGVALYPGVPVSREHSIRFRCAENLPVAVQSLNGEAILVLPGRRAWSLVAERSIRQRFLPFIRNLPAPMKEVRRVLVFHSDVKLNCAVRHARKCHWRRATVEALLCRSPIEGDTHPSMSNARERERQNASQDSSQFSLSYVPESDHNWRLFAV